MWKKWEHLYKCLYKMKKKKYSSRYTESEYQNWLKNAPGPFVWDQSFDNKDKYITKQLTYFRYMYIFFI